MPLRRDESGQAQILAALSIGLILMSAALFALQHAQQTASLQVRGAKRGEMRVALDSAIKHAAQIYRNEAGCDPIELNERLARLQPDGSIAPSPTAPARPSFPPTAAYPATYRREMDVTINGTTFPVVFGPVYHVMRADGVNYANTDTPGRAMDAMIEVWTTTLGNVRVQQRAVLINNCSYLCSSADGNNICPSKTADVNDDGVVYHRIGAAPGDTTVSWPDITNALRDCRGGRRVGDVDATDCSAHKDRIDTTDLVVLRNYLRTGTYAGSCNGILDSSGGSCGACSTAGTGSCADLNNDGLVDEADLNILEKLLRGYLNTMTIPP